jgi:FAD/FMN-containing dehydrogenase
VVVLAVFHDGDPAAAEKAIEPLRKFGQTVGEHVGQMPYTAWQQAFDPLLVRAPQLLEVAQLHAARGWGDRRHDGLRTRLPSPLADIFVGQVGGVANRVAPDATAYHHRDARYVLNVHARWERPDEDAACIAWARDFFRATEPFATGGVYVNFLTDDETARIGAAYGPNYARLAQIKRTYDPQNLFSTNQNIAPAS